MAAKIKYLFLQNSNLKQPIEFNKLGIIIRKISIEEVNSIIINFKPFFSNRIQKHYNAFVVAMTSDKDSEEGFNAWMENKEALRKNLKIYGMREECEKANKEFTLKAFRKFLSSMLIAEINTETISKHFGSYDYNILVRRLFLFSLYINEQVDVDKNLDQIVINKIEDIQNASFENNGVYRLFSLYKEPQNYGNNIDLIKLKNISNFMNSEDTIFNYDFMNTIQSLMLRRTWQNEIVEIVSIIEKLLLNKEESTKNILQESFALKAGVLCYGLFNLDQKKYKKLLKTLYQVRSDIVHGSSEKFISEQDKYNNILELDYFSTTDKSKFSQEAVILASTELCLNKIVKRILNQYIDNTQFCKFLKG